MFKVLENGTAPTRGSKYSACVDLYASEDVAIGAGETKLVGLGVCIDNLYEVAAKDFCNILELNQLNDKDSVVDEFKKSHYLQLMLRSSLGKKGLIIPNGVGVIDLDYKDEIKLLIHNPVGVRVYVENGINYTVLEDSFDMECKIKKGDRIAQIALLEHKSYLFGIDSDDVRDGGFGSTNK